MARIRRPKKITGGEYTFGAGSSDALTGSDFIKVIKGNPDKTNASFDGFLKSGSTVTVDMDQNQASIANDEYIYFDNAFEGSDGVVSIEYLNGDTAMPAGMSQIVDTDVGNSDEGYARIYGTPTAVGKNSFKIKVDYPGGEETAEITYVLNVLPVGFTPVWSTKFPDEIIEQSAAEQTLLDGPVTGYSGATYSLSNVSGFVRGIIPTIDAQTGRVYVMNTPGITKSASTHSLTVTADLGEYGTVSKEFSGSIAYGPAYGALYFGPANLRFDIVNTGHDYRESTDADLKDGSSIFNRKYRSGALYKFYDPAGEDYDESTPYYTQNGYGNHWENRENAYQYTNVTSDVDVELGRGYLISEGRVERKMNSTTNHSMIEVIWTAPVDVTSFSAVCVGAGGPGTYTWSSYGGGGGGLAWLNAITCEPGEEFDVGIGMGMYSQNTDGPECGGSSYIRRRSNGEMLIIGQAGGYNHSSGFNVYSNQTVTQTEGGDLVWQASNPASNQRNGGGFAYNDAYGTAGGGMGGYSNSRMGGGAGGYRGNGGSNNQNGLGGGGGGGNYYSSTYGVSGGGGVGLDGQGWNGSIAGSVPRLDVDAGSGNGGGAGPYTVAKNGRGSYRYGGGGGSGGARGIYGENPQQSTPEHGSGVREIGGGHHGGGGGGSGSSGSYGGGNSGPGGVRIIWGLGADGSAREFPYTYTTEDPDMKYNGEKE